MANVSDFIIQRIREWGVTRVFAFPGDGIGEFDGALGAAQREGDGLDYIRPTHEEICSLMATAHAKFTGEVGVCVATSSPAPSTCSTGCTTRRATTSPSSRSWANRPSARWARSSSRKTTSSGRCEDVAVYVQTIVTPQQAQAVVDTAFRTALVRLGPAVIVLPHDVQGMDMPKLKPANGVSRSSSVAPRSQSFHPKPRSRRPPSIINAGNKVTFLVGHGSNGATDEVLAAAKLCGAGIITALRAKQVVPSDVAFHTQQLGLLGTRPSQHQMDDCDTLVLLGTNYPYSQFLPKTGQARAIQVDLKPEQMGLRYPTELNIWGDVKQTLLALIPHLHKKTDLSWQEGVAKGMVEWENEMQAQAMLNLLRRRQPTARLPRAEPAAAGQGDRHLRRWLHRGLVRAPHPTARRHDG